MPSIKLSAEAGRDYEEILDYTFVTWGYEQFEKYGALLDEAFHKLARRPAAFGKRRDDIFPGCRIHYVGRHAVLYRQAINGIEIARILHKRMYYKEHIPDRYKS